MPVHHGWQKRKSSAKAEAGCKAEAALRSWPHRTTRRIRIRLKSNTPRSRRVARLKGHRKQKNPLFPYRKNIYLMKIDLMLFLFFFRIDPLCSLVLIS
jgi:hypothetical protein